MRRRLKIYKRDSSHLREIAYDDKSPRILEIEFNDGSVYQYPTESKTQSFFEHFTKLKERKRAGEDVSIGEEFDRLIRQKTKRYPPVKTRKNNP